MAGITYPDNTRVDYAPNALGEPGKAGPFASNISFHANGALAGFTYGNGIVHSMQQNLRNLPAISQDGSILKDQYRYDPNGNVSAIDDMQERSYDRKMNLIALIPPPRWATGARPVTPMMRKTI